MQKTPTLSASFVRTEKIRNRHVVRWYVMVYPSSGRAMTEDLERELIRRHRDNESLFEYFAPMFVEVKRVNGKLIDSRRPLLYNYLFIHSSEAEIYRIKQRYPQYNFLPRVRDGKDEYHYPYLSDRAMRDLQWIARSYAEPIPICAADPAWLVKGDRIRITEGRFQGIEAQVVTSTPSRHKEILVSIDEWMCVPLLKVQPGEYEIIELNAENPRYYARLNNDRLQERLHEALCRYHLGKTTPEDRNIALKILQQYALLSPESDVIRCKLYSLLLPAYILLNDKAKFESLVHTIQGMLPGIKAEQSRALLIVTLYGCTDNHIYYDQAHALVNAWHEEKNLKKSKIQLLKHLEDYDRWFGHAEG